MKQKVKTDSRKGKAKKTIEKWKQKFTRR